MSRRSAIAAWCASMSVAAVAALALALVLGGGAPVEPPPGIAGSDRLPQWLTAFARLAGWLVGTVTVGLGVLASSVSPRWLGRAARGAVLWIAVTVLQLGLLGWELRGQVELFDTTRGRALVAQLALAALAAIAFAVGRAAWAAIGGAACAAAALLPVVVTGHPRSADHRVLATISASVHVLAAAAWIGGLAVLSWMAATDTGDWRRALPRYSRLALACVVALGAAGIAAAVERVGSPDALFTSRYGAIVTIKTVLLAGLIGAGWLQRREVLGRSPIRRRDFVLVAAVELSTMALAVALAVALARTPPPS